jgi:hypothetical protein
MGTDLFFLSLEKMGTDLFFLSLGAILEIAVEKNRSVPIFSRERKNRSVPIFLSKGGGSRG